MNKDSNVFMLRYVKVVLDMEWDYVKGVVALINYIKLKKFSLRFYYYVFLDTEKYLADNLFINHRVVVYFGPEFVKEQTPYRFICCKVKKKDEEGFIEALIEMYDKALLLGYEDYLDYCKIFNEKLAKMKNEPDNQDKTLK